jgi:hypothetical protein
MKIPQHDDQMDTVKMLLDEINIKVVQGLVRTDDYELFLNSLNDNLPPNFRIRRTRKI